jgi:hypothetical protein
MKLYSIVAIATTTITGISAVNVSTTDTKIATQTISIPQNYDISFARGTYEIIKAPYTSKTQLSDEELITILKQAGFSKNNLKMAKAIVFYESTNRPLALNKKSNCYGLFQINMSGSMGPDRRERYGLESNEDLLDPLTNAKVAYHMSAGGSNWSAWETKNIAKKSIDN